MLLPHFRLKHPSSIFVLAVLPVLTAARKSCMFLCLMDEEKRVTALSVSLWLYITHAQLHSDFSTLGS